jgi:PAS domain S-box-containing protein
MSPEDESRNAHQESDDSWTANGSPCVDLQECVIMEEAFGLLIDNLPDHVMFVDTDGRILFINHTVADLTTEEAVGSLFLEHLAPDQAGLARDAFDRAKCTGTPTRFEVAYQVAGTADPLHFETIVTPVERDGDLIGCVMRATDITDRKRTEHDLTETRRRFEEIAGAIDDVFWITDWINHRLLFVSPAYETIWGRPREALYADPVDWVAGVHADDRERVAQAFLGMADTGTYDEEFRLVRPDGDVRWVRDRGFLIRDDEGRPCRVAGIAQDVTAERTMKEALHASEAFNRSIIDNSRDCIKVLDTEGRLLFMNEGGMQLMGITDFSAYAGSFYEELWAEDTRERVRRAVTGARNGQTAHFEGGASTVEGDVKWWDVVISPIPGPGGATDRLLSVSRDITEHRRAEDRLRRLSEAVEQSPASVLITDVDGIIQYVNPRFTAITGYPADEAVGRNPRILNAGVQPGAFYDRLWSTIRSGQLWSGEFCNRKKSGELYWESASISPIRDANDRITHFVGVKEDITSQKEAAEELARAKQTAEAANRAKSEFLANMSHELRTPLNAIIGFSEVLSDRKFGELNEKQARHVGHILSSGNHLLALINDILDLSKIEAGRMEIERTAVDLPRLLEGCVVLVREKAAKQGVQLSLTLSTVLSDCGVMLDERKVKQVVFNLLSNAVKFTPSGGEIRVGVEVHPGENGSDILELRVSDTGIGIRDKDRTRIFGEFEQGDASYARSRDGTGLGLALARRIVELHGGRIWAESEGEGKGSTFVVRMPFAQGES